MNDSTPFVVSLKESLSRFDQESDAKLEVNSEEAGKRAGTSSSATSPSGTRSKAHSSESKRSPPGAGTSPLVTGPGAPSPEGARSKATSPLSGAEPAYVPEIWNEPLTMYNHNCYAYVLDKRTTNRRGKPQPGYFAGYGKLRAADYNCETLYERLHKDNPTLFKSTFEAPCPPGFSKGYIAIDPKEADQDYHFYRLDSSGLWSHKPGRGAATNLDASGDVIVNPATANRRYKYYDYTMPCFFFCMNSSMGRTAS